MFDIPQEAIEPPSHYEYYTESKVNTSKLYAFNCNQSNSFLSSIPKSVIAGMIDVDPDDTADISYSEIAYTDDDLHKIDYIITNLGSVGYLDLLKQEKTMRQYGRDVEHIHPLKFLALIFNNPTLKGHMKSLSETWIKWKLFMKDLSARLDAEKEIGKVDEYLPDFCEDVNVPQSRIKPYTDNWDWDGLVKVLIISK